MTNPVDAVLAAAKHAAEKNAQAQVPATQEVIHNDGNVAVYNSQPVAKRITLQDVEDSSGVLVDAFLKPQSTGVMYIGTSLVPVEEIIVDFTVSEDSAVSDVIGQRTLCYGSDPVTYVHTLDNVTTTSGGSWEQALKKAQMVKPDVAPYPSYAMKMVLVEDAIGTVNKKTEVVLEAGKSVGYSTTATATKKVAALIKEIIKSELLDEKVRVKITVVRATSKKGFTWGSLEYELLGEAPK